MTPKLTAILSYLEPLIAFDTRNGVGEELACARWLEGKLAAHHPDRLVLRTTPRTRERPDGAYVLAVWGTPRLVINVHLDTVPSGEGWDSPPLTLTKDEERYVGLGSADIKGAMACILANLDARPPKDVAVLFSGDEEQGSEVMIALLARGELDGIHTAIICEPTLCRPGVRHRGFVSYAITFKGPGGHSSGADHMAAPVLRASELAARLGKYGRDTLDVGPDGFKGLCMNIGCIKSDGAHNVVPTYAELRFSFRPPPGDDYKARSAEIEAIIAAQNPEAEILQMTCFPSFETHNANEFAAIAPVIHTAPLNMPFWTEAALLAELGINAIVLGPGDIETAHRPNEYVTGEQLLRASEIYARALSGGPS